MLNLFRMMGLLPTATDSGGGVTSSTPAGRRVTFVYGVVPSTIPGVPTDTRVFTEGMDPYDIVDFEMDLTGLLEAGESLTSATLSLPSESVLLGLTVNTAAPYGTTLTGNILKFYLSVSSGDQSNKAFNGSGILLPIEVRIDTNATPPRRKQRTAAVRVVQR